MRILRTLLIALMPLVALPAFAAETVPFDQARFAEAQHEGRPILVRIWASWCPTCAAQTPILEKLESEPAYRNLIVFKVDFDKQKDTVRAFKATEQSTLIGFKGATETGRSVGDTDEKSIAKLLQSTAG
ncbi:MAG TPA: thioredoxin family protein [Stellaceae bacterium]|nr:thioredoxin family protein [Stellaceae bacterium]